MKFCHQCGKQNPDEAKFCGFCGYKFEPLQNQQRNFEQAPQFLPSQQPQQPIPISNQQPPYARNLPPIQSQYKNYGSQNQDFIAGVNDPQTGIFSRVWQKISNLGTRTILIIITLIFLIMILCLTLSVMLKGFSSIDGIKSAEAVIKAFQTVNIPISSMIYYTANDDPNKLLGRPNQYVAKVNWKDSRILDSGDPGTDTGGSLEVFNNSDDALRRKTYIESIGKSLSMLTEYLYLKQSMLLRISHKLTPDQAKEYENIFVNISPIMH